MMAGVRAHASGETVIEDLWYKNAVIYNLDLETFMDANGDGVSDFEGLTRRLDYLRLLGEANVMLEESRKCFADGGVYLINVHVSQHFCALASGEAALTRRR